MAIGVNLETISSGYNTSKLNINYQTIETALQDAVSRSGAAPNQMNADFDMNGNDILNVDRINTASLTVGDLPIIPGNVSIDPNSLVPVGGTVGQVLTKLSSTDYNDAWVTLPNDLPVGGTDGQVLTKQSATNFDVNWENAPASTPVVSTRTALKALDTTSITSAFLNELGREGVFLWKTGNYSALITLDTREGVYIKADAIASTSGAWVRSNKVDLNAYMFGAVGDGVTDDYAALQGYANVCGYIGSPFRITDTAESYAISAKLVCKVTRNLDTSDVTPASDVHFTDNLPFIIEGLGNAKLLATAPMTSMIELIFDAVDSDIGPFYTLVRNLHLDGAGQATAGFKSDYTMHITYDGNRIQGCTRGIEYTGYGVFRAHNNVIRCKYGFYLAGGGGDSVISNNDLISAENTSACILFGYTSGNTVIRDNTFTNQEGYTTSYGVQVNGGLAPASEETRHLVIADNEFCGMSAGVRMDGKATGNKNIWNNIIKGNHVTQLGASNPGQLISAVDSTDMIIEGNFCNSLRINDASSIAMEFLRCLRVVVRDNEIAAYLPTPISLTDCTDFDIVGNRLFDCGKTGTGYALIIFFGASSARNHVRRNVLDQSSASYGQLGIFENTGVDGTIAEQNDFRNIATPYTKVGANSKMSTTVDNTVARYDGTTGALQSSGVAIGDGDNITNTVGSGQPYTATMQNATNFSAGIELRKRGATGDATAAIASSSEMGFHSFLGWDGSAYGRGSFVFVTTTQAWSVGAHGTQYQIYTTPNGSATNALALTVGQDGSVKLSQPLGGLGYTTGAGGTVTQATNKSTGVTLNKVTGQITMNGAALAAATIVSFTLTNSAVAATDVLVLNHVSGGTLGAYTLNAACAAGTATITIRNNTAGSLSEALVLGFAVIKGAIA